MSFLHRNRISARLLAVAGVVMLSRAAAAVDFANISMTLNAADPVNGVPTVTIPAGQSTVTDAALGTQGFFLDPGAVMGEYPIRIGASASDDAAGGVLLGYVAENGRDVSGFDFYATSSTVADGDPTSTNTRGGTGGLSLAVHRAGEANPASQFPLHAPFAADLAAAYFPFDQGWLGGTAFSSTNGGPIDQFVGSPGLSLGTNFVVDGVGTNKHQVSLPGVTDSRRQGLLFVNHAKNEANYAMSEPDDEGDGFVVVTHDNATDGPDLTVDPVSFVYIPLDTPNVTMARVHASSGQDLQPTAMLQSGGPFTITTEGPVEPTGFTTGVGGRFRLSIPGESPSSGVLLVSPSTVGRASNTSTGVYDNIVTYEADGDDWIILTQDLPEITGEGEYSRERNSRFNFAFIPFDSPPTAPAPIPAPNFTRERIVGWNTEVTEEVFNNDTGSNFVTVTQHTTDVPVQGLSENLGDIGFSVAGDFMTIEDGVLFATINEGLRNNFPTGGQFEYGVASTGLFVPEWIAFIEPAAPNVPREMNINFASVFFGADSGFNPVSNAPIAAGNLEVSIPGANSLTDGVLMANRFGNEDDYALVTPKADGSGWDVEVHDNNTTLIDEAAANYVYLPFDSENLIAGRVDEDGALLASTDTSGFTLTKEDTGMYRLSIPGKSPETGMLMLNGTGPTGSVDNTLVYETEGTDFMILGLDMITTAEANAGTLVELEDTEFSFAYIDFDAPPIAPGVDLAGDYNGNGIVDAADYTVWRDSLGQTGPGLAADGNGDNMVTEADYTVWKTNFGEGGSGSGLGAAVPEPTGGLLWLLGIATWGCTLGRRSLSRFRSSPNLSGKS